MYQNTPGGPWKAVLALLLIAAVVVPAAAQASATTVVDDGGLAQPSRHVTEERQAEAVEIREYQGERLGSVDDFRDNSIRGTQFVDMASYRLVVDGLVVQTASWSYAELAAFERQAKLVTIHCVEGWSVKALWEGIPLAAIFEHVEPLESVNTVVFHAADGYTTSLPIETVLDRDLIIADRINDIALPPENGFPFQLVAEDKWGYKWIKWIVRIELSDDLSYRGFWEERGYSNDGDTDGPKFGD